MNEFSRLKSGLQPSKVWILSCESLDSTSGVPSWCRPDLKVDRVEVGLPQATALNADERVIGEFGDELRHAGYTHAHVPRQSFLPWKAEVVVPGVREEHRIGEFGADREIGVAQDEVGDLGKTKTRRRIEGIQLDVLFTDDFTDGMHALILPCSGLSCTQSVSTGRERSSINP